MLEAVIGACAFLSARVLLAVFATPAFLMDIQKAWRCRASWLEAFVYMALLCNAGRAGTSFLSVHEPAESFRVKVHVIGSSSFDESVTHKIAGLEQNRLDYEKRLFDEASAFIPKS